MIDMNTIEKINSAAKDAPPLERPLSVADAIKKLAPAIKTLRGKGYTYEQIVEVFVSYGVTVSAYTIKRHMRVSRSASKSSRGSA